MTSKPLFPHAVGMIAPVVAAGLLLSGCTSSSGSHGTPTPSATSGSNHATASTAPSIPAGVVQDAGSATVPNDPALRKNVTLTACTKTSTGYSAGGSATNSGTKKQTYVVTVFFS